MSTRDYARRKVAAFMRQARRNRRLRRAALNTFAGFVLAALPSWYGSDGTLAGAEYDNACREQVTATRFVAHYGGCLYLDTRVPVVVTADGVVYRVSPGNRPDVRLFTR